jgi:hypothetical protein
MVSTSITTKKRMPSIRTFTDSPEEEGGILTVSLLLAVRRMFSLLYYLGILSHLEPLVKHYF